MQRVHQYWSAVGVHYGGRLFPRRTVTDAWMVWRRRHGCMLLQRVRLVVVLLLLLLHVLLLHVLLLHVQLAGECVGSGAVHDGRRVILHAVVIVGCGRHALAAVRVPVAGGRYGGQRRRGRSVCRGRIVVVCFGRLHRHVGVVARRSGVYDFWFSATCAHQQHLRILYTKDGLEIMIL